MGKFSSTAGSSTQPLELKDFLLVYMGIINKVTGKTDDENMKNFTVNKKHIFTELHRLNIFPNYWIKSRIEVRTRLKIPWTDLEFPYATRKWAYHTFEIFHLVDEDGPLPDLFLSIERQQIGVVMQVSSNEETVKNWFRGEKREETMDVMHREDVGIRLTQFIERLNRKNYLSTTYCLVTNNCQQLRKKLNQDLDEDKGKNY